MELKQKGDNPYAAPESLGAGGLDPLELDALGAPSLGKRFLAVVVDNILVTAVTTLCFLALMELAEESMWVGLANTLIGISLRTLYYTVLESSALKGTLGKRMLGLAVVDAQGHQLTFGRSAARAVSRSFLMAFYFPGLWVVFDKRGQGVWDHIATTRVVERSYLLMLESEQR